MGIGFTPERWKRVRTESRAWWAGNLKRPLIQLTLTGRDPGRPEPKLPAYGYQSFYDFSIPAEAIIDRIDYELSCVDYLGDAFPNFWPNFGPGVMAAFLGCDTVVEPKTTWFQRRRVRPISELHFEYDPDNMWWRRVQQLYRAAVARWEGRVQISMTDLGGTLDILSSFRPGEQLLYDLHDHPADVHRLIEEVHGLWWKYFQAIDAIVHPSNPGYTAWAPIFSESPYYMLQCDFAFMIGPDMFDEFVKPELEASCRKLDHAFYHLDGPGQLRHLDSILGIEALKGVQWIPGAGAKPQSEWPALYGKIRNAGRRIQVFAQGDEFNSRLHYRWLDKLVQQLGDGKGIVMLNAAAPLERKAEALEFLAKHGAL